MNYTNILWSLEINPQFLEIDAKSSSDVWKKRVVGKLLDN